jgi:alanyl-tRNA synthetase
MLSRDIRSSFLGFFKKYDHLVLPSFSLIPQNDPTLLLVGAGMAPLKPYFTGEKIPPNRRMATCQKCVRTPDIERVGRTSRHATFFEMLGNFSFGDYFKDEAIAWAWELVTRDYNLPEDRLYVSVYREDDEAYDIWHKKIGIPARKIFRLGKEDNFWEIGPGPCGPCSEIYYDLGEKHGCGRQGCEVGCDCDRFMEIWNLVFTQFDRTEQGEYIPLENKNIDTGAGLERVAVVLQGVGNLFEIDTVRPLLDHFCAAAGREYGRDGESDVSLRIITEHLRGISFMIGDGILPGNEGRGYVLRRLLRRAVRHGRLLGLDEPFLHAAVPLVADLLGDPYAELVKGREHIGKVIKLEEERFFETLEQGMRILDDLMGQSRSGVFSGEAAFRLYDTFGFPVDLTREILAERGLTLDDESFRAALEAQRERARSARASVTSARDDAGWQEIRDIKTNFVGYERHGAAAEILALLRDGRRVASAMEGEEVEIVLNVTPFYGEQGGQVGDRGRIVTQGGIVVVTDTVVTPTEQIVHRGRVESGAVSAGEPADVTVETAYRGDICRNHTATHLLHRALQEVLGDHVRQAGSLVAHDRLRFDFTHISALAQAQLEEVERRVNSKIRDDSEVRISVVSMDEAREMGATALFDEKYGDKVRVVAVADYSMELCGGTHVTSTGQIGLFKILSESGIGAGLRRIEALTGQGAFDFLIGRNKVLEQAAQLFKAPAEQLPDKLSELNRELKDLQRENQRLQLKLAGMEVDSLLERVSREDGVPVLSVRVSAGNMETLREMADRLKNKMESGVIVLGAAAGGRVLLVASVTPDLVKAGYHAGRLIGEVARLTGGGGGGRPDMAQAGGKNSEDLDHALSQVNYFVRNQKK